MHQVLSIYFFATAWRYIIETIFYADFAGDSDTSQSWQVYLFFLDKGSIVWKEGNQNIVLATSAAEIVALMNVCVLTKH